MKVIGWLDKQDVNSQWRLGRLCSGWLKQATDWSRPRTSKWSEKCRANGSLIGSIDWHHQSMDNKQRWDPHGHTRYICQQSFVCIGVWPPLCTNTAQIVFDSITLNQTSASTTWTTTPIRNSIESEPNQSNAISGVGKIPPCFDIPFQIFETKNGPVTI